LEDIQRNVMAMTEEEIARLPPEIRMQVEEVRGTLRRQRRP
jgi:hypothetical protein